ncbi:hypothetical protein [Rummeliibacillus sp. TYF-LIM-RU47]|uniref:hypothetical protein n=1 Tax=Rummeliibacillus sp. TYF-LIM-RU47 TaxID=2608406 RepID=UPI00123BA1CD|nr:hypothetical protein [Rummeliibacillus sp. TYF-LIM-RU47]
MATGDKYYLGGQKVFTNYYSGSELVGKTEVKVNLGFKTSCIKYISNDSENGSLYVSFDSVPTTATASGLNKAILLNPGEVINELNIAVSSINLRLIGYDGISIARWLAV